MRPTDAVTVLQVCAAFDNRTISEIDAEAWAAALTVSTDPSLDEAKAAVVAHYAETTDWCMVAHVNRLIKANRRRRLDAAGPLPRPPQDLAGEDYIAWRGAWQFAVSRGMPSEEADAYACKTIGADPPDGQPELDFEDVAALIEAAKPKVIGPAREPVRHPTAATG